MASRFILPFADVGGGITPSDGALLEFFAAGTSIQKDTFTNEALSIANTNPVVADANGVFADIWLPDGGRYKVTLDDKNIVQKFEADPVIGGQSSGLAKAPFDNVAAMVASKDLNIGDIVNTAGYTTKGDGGQNQYEIVSAATGTDDGGSFIDLTGITGQAKGLFPGGVINVKQFGAVGDGATDATTEFTNCNALGQVVIPKGVYKLSTITITNSAEFEGGASVTAVSGQTIKFNGGIKAGEFQLFAGTATYEVRESLSVRWFGAVGDGSTDDHDAFQKALDSLPTVGGVVYMPVGGWWVIGSELQMSNPAVTLQGTGIGNSSRMLFTDTTFIGINITANDCTVQNLSFGYSARTGTSTGIQDSASGGTRLLSVKIDGGHNGIKSDSAKSLISDVSVINTTPTSSVGLTIQSTAEVREIRNFFFENAPGNDAFAGIQILDGAGIQISNCDLQKCGKPLHIMSDDITRTIASVNIDNTFFDTSSSDAVFLEVTGTGRISRTRISNSWMTSCSTGLHISGDVFGVIVTGCEICDNAAEGIEVEANSDVDGLIVTGCTIAGNSSDGIKMKANVGDFTFTGNHIAPGAAFGANFRGIVIEAGTADNYVVTGNRLRGNTSTSLVDNGTGVNKVVANNLT